MSLILDALKKLERDKRTGEPGVVVVGSVPWGERTRTRRRLVLGLGVLGAMALAVATTWLLVRTPKAPTPPGEAGTPIEHRPAPAAFPARPSSKSPSTARAPGADAVAPPRDPRPALPGPASANAAAPATARVGTSPAAAPETTPPASASGTTAPPPPARGTDDLRLNAISQRDGRPVALINDRLVFEGDSFEGIRVLRIGETEVEVEIDGKRRILRF